MSVSCKNAFWRVVAENVNFREKASKGQEAIKGCELCDDPANGILQCSQEHCKREYHIACAYDYMEEKKLGIWSHVMDCPLTRL